MTEATRLTTYFINVAENSSEDGILTQRRHTIYADDGNQVTPVAYVRDSAQYPFSPEQSTLLSRTLEALYFGRSASITAANRTAQVTDLPKIPYVINYYAQGEDGHNVFTVSHPNPKDAARPIDQGLRFVVMPGHEQTLLAALPMAIVNKAGYDDSIRESFLAAQALFKSKTDVGGFTHVERQYAFWQHNVITGSDSSLLSVENKAKQRFFLNCMAKALGDPQALADQFPPPPDEVSNIRYGHDGNRYTIYSRSFEQPLARLFSFTVNAPYIEGFDQQFKSAINASMLALTSPRATQELQRIAREDLRLSLR